MTPWTVWVSHVNQLPDISRTFHTIHTMNVLISVCYLRHLTQSHQKPKAQENLMDCKRLVNTIFSFEMVRLEALAPDRSQFLIPAISEVLKVFAQQYLTTVNRLHFASPAESMRKHILCWTLKYLQHVRVVITKRFTTVSKFACYKSSKNNLHSFKSAEPHWHEWHEHEWELSPSRLDKMLKDASESKCLT